MSQFSDKLLQYITESGYNIYQLAKETALDRTTLQKTVKGQRLPSLDYLKKVCNSIKISKAQEEELIRLYKIEKLGPETIETWEEIHNMLLDINKLRNKIKDSNIWKVQFDKSILNSNIEGYQGKLLSELDIMKAVMCIIEHEIIEEDKPEVFMDVSYASQYALSQIVESQNITHKQVTCHQFVNLRRTEHSKAGILSNIELLHQVLPYAFAFQDNYDIRYTYVDGNIYDLKYEIMPHYIVTHKHVLLCSHNNYNAILVSDNSIVESYYDELRRMHPNYRPLFIYQGLSGEGIRLYRDMFKSIDTQITVEPIPCIALMAPKELREEKSNDPIVGEYVKKYLVTPDVAPENYINIFGMKKMTHMLQTGHLPGVYDMYIGELDIPTRKAMAYNFLEKLKNHERKFYMLNETNSSLLEEYSIEMYGRSKIVFSTISHDFTFGFITIDEPGICETFYNYILNFIESPNVYGIEESITRYEDMINEWLREL